MSKVLRVLVFEALIAHVWGSYVAMAVLIALAQWGPEPVGGWVYVGLIAPVTLPMWAD